MKPQPQPDARAAWPATPLHVKREEHFDWPRGPKLFYLLSSSGLFKCRNHEFFRSCVPAQRGPAELSGQEPFLQCAFPRIPRELFERVVGFFDRIRELHNAEASVLLAYDRENEAVEVVVPDQTATVSRYSGGRQYPLGLHYYPPTDLPPGWVLFGDIHSHVDLAAYSSATDVHDETHSAGLHIVVGRLYREPAEVHVEAVVDGERFQLRFDDVVEGYQARSSDVPDEWLDRVEVEVTSSWGSYWSAPSSEWSAADSSSSWSWEGWSGSDSTRDDDPASGHDGYR